jgi:NhaP-type Na+/H+ or K+/H+ antiporter
LVSTALRLPDRYFFEQWRSIATLLTFGMLSMWLISGILVYWLLDVSIWSALLLGAVVTPTDPVQASAIVTGKVAEENIPARVRHLLSAEAGANDGLAFLLVAFLPPCLTRSPGEALHHWVTRSLLGEILLAVVVGVGIGYAAGRLQQWIQRVFAHDLDYSSLMTVALALSLSVLGVVELLGGNGILVTFAAGIAFNSIVHGQHEADQERIQEQVKRFFDLPVFILLGSTLPCLGVGLHAEKLWHSSSKEKSDCCAIAACSDGCIWLPQLQTGTRGQSCLQASADGLFGIFGGLRAHPRAVPGCGGPADQARSVVMTGHLEVTGYAS